MFMSNTTEASATQHKENFDKFGVRFSGKVRLG
jgi:hypothetical protein